MTEDDTFKILKRASFPEVKEIVDRQAKDLDSLLNILHKNGWNTTDWKLACEEDSARRRPPLKVPAPRPPKSTPPIPSNYIHQKDNQFAPKIDDVSEYMRNLTIIK